MALTLDLPKDLEHRLTAEAMRLGLPVEQSALKLLGVTPKAEKASSSGAEFVAFWRHEGVIGSRPDITDSQAHAREIRHRAERRTRIAFGSPFVGRTLDHLRFGDKTGYGEDVREVS